MNGIRRIRRLAGVLAAVIAGLLASAAVAPAAFATPKPQPLPGGQYGPAPVTPVPATIIRVINTGMPGWQITLIAIGAALLAATVAVLLDRARATRRNAAAVAA